MPVIQNKIAFIYDFDGTLIPDTMQSHTVLPDAGICPTSFFQRCDAEAKRLGADPALTYLRLLKEEMTAAGKPLTRAYLNSFAEKIKYFPGVNSFFERMSDYVKRQSDHRVVLEHYIVSAGNREIIEKTALFTQCRAVYASEYHYDATGEASFVNRAITDIAKTQYLYRINKGALCHEDPVNDHMPQPERPVPFAQMVYFGDGLTDVPSMSTVQREGGHAIAVYPEGDQTQAEKCHALKAVGRVDFAAAADYRDDGELATKTYLLLDKLVADICYKLNAL